MTTSKGFPSIDRRPLPYPRLATRQTETHAFETLGHGLGVRRVVVDNQHLGRRAGLALVLFYC